MLRRVPRGFNETLEEVLVLTGLAGRLESEAKKRQAN